MTDTSVKTIAHIYDKIKNESISLGTGLIEAYKAGMYAGYIGAAETLDDSSVRQVICNGMPTIPETKIAKILLCASTGIKQAVSEVENDI